MSNYRILSDLDLARNKIENVTEIVGSKYSDGPENLTISSSSNQGNLVLESPLGKIQAFVGEEPSKAGIEIEKKEDGTFKTTISTTSEITGDLTVTGKTKIGDSLEVTTTSILAGDVTVSSGNVNLEEGDLSALNGTIQSQDLVFSKTLKAKVGENTEFIIRWDENLQALIFEGPSLKKSED